MLSGKKVIVVMPACKEEETVERINKEVAFDGKTFLILSVLTFILRNNPRQ
jgi:hypothetical protein